jgi:PHD/YefM family antitoxin component YafN of YafNO toxin-antitoxin module
MSGEKMNIVSFTEARNSLKSVLDKVSNNVDYTVITILSKAMPLYQFFTLT